MALYEVCEIVFDFVFYELIKLFSSITSIKGVIAASLPNLSFGLRLLKARACQQARREM